MAENMGEQESVRVSRDIKRNLDTSAAKPVNISKEKKEEIRRWIEATIGTLINSRDAVVKKHAKYISTLSGQRFTAAPRRGVSNMSVPLTLWASAGLRARALLGVFGDDPVVTATPIGEVPSDIPVGEVGKDLGMFLSAAIKSPHILNGKAAVGKVITESTNLGTAALKVLIVPPEVNLVPPVLGENRPTTTPTPAKIRWDHVAFKDLIYWDGFGTDTQAMPYVGHQIRKTWSDILKWKALGYYYAEDVKKVQQFYSNQTKAGSSFAGNEGELLRSPSLLRPHDIAEIYMDFVLDDAVGLPAPIVVDYHLKANKVLRVAWNRNPDGTRPVFVGQFDENPDPTKLSGQGVCQKLEGAQDEADEIHNIGIEAGKRAAAFLVGVRYGSHAEQDLGGDEAVMPGDKYASEDPQEDLVTKQLGDHRAAEASIALEEHTRVYVMRILGFDEGRLGNVESGKRVPASLGLAISREGRVISTHHLNSIATMMADALYLTMDLMKQVTPEAALVSVLGPEKADLFMNTVFGLEDVKARDQFILTVSAQDAATAQEEKKQDLLILTQFLMGFYDKVLGYAQIALQLPPEIRNIMAVLIEKLENSVRSLLASTDSIRNADEVLPDMARMIKQLDSLAAGSAGRPAPLTGVIEPERDEDFWA